MTQKNHVASHSQEQPKTYPFGLKTLMELFDIGPLVATIVLTAAALIVMTSIMYFVHSAPPSKITISTGPEGSVFYKNAQKYAAILKKNGVELKILTSEGSLQNLQRLVDPKSKVDLAIAQGGIKVEGENELLSLASISYQPLFFFYNGAPKELLSEFKGKKIAIGPEGSGSRGFALSLLALNDIKEGGDTQLLDYESDKASQALLNHEIDGAFIMSENAATEILHNLLRNPDIRLFNFKQANAYSRKIDYLNILEMPQGSVEIGKDIPPHDVTLLGPMVEIVATQKFHPALVDLVLEAATEVHNHSATYQKRGEFPTAIEHAIPVSEDSTRFFKSGKGFLFRYLPFWIASLIERILVVFLPMLLLLIPAIKSIPAAFRWRIQMKIRRRYRELLNLEKQFLVERDNSKIEDMRKDFDEIEKTVNNMKIPPRFADQYYGLRGHIDYVRSILFSSIELEKKIAK